MTCSILPGLFIALERFQALLCTQGGCPVRTLTQVPGNQTESSEPEQAKRVQYLPAKRETGLSRC